MSALPRIATAKADFRKKVMSALPPKADVCGALADVRFGPKADNLCGDARERHVAAALLPTHLDKSPDLTAARRAAGSDRKL